MDRTSMKPQPDLLTKAGRKALGNGMKENWTPLKQHYRLARTWQTMLYLYLYFIIIIFFNVYCQFLLSTVHRQCGDIRVQLAACGGPSGMREVKKVLMNDQAADRKPGWCGSAFIGSSGPSSPLSPSSSSMPSSIIRSYRQEKKRWLSLQCKTILEFLVTSNNSKMCQF